MPKDLTPEVPQYAGNYLEQLEMFKHGFPARDDVPIKATAKAQTIIQSLQQIKACGKPVSEITEGAKRVVKKFLEDIGLDVSCFDIDKIIRETQIRNGMLRAECKGRLNIWAKKSKTQLDLFLQDKYAIKSPHTEHMIRWGKR
jgi:hypothetical protein